MIFQMYHTKISDKNRKPEYTRLKGMVQNIINFFKLVDNIKYKLPIALGCHSSDTTYKFQQETMLLNTALDSTNL